MGFAIFLLFCSSLRHYLLHFKWSLFGNLFLFNKPPRIFMAYNIRNLLLPLISSIGQVFLLLHVMPSEPWGWPSPKWPHSWQGASVPEHVDAQAFSQHGNWLPRKGSKQCRSPEITKHHFYHIPLVKGSCRTNIDSREEGIYSTFRWGGWQKIQGYLLFPVATKTTTTNACKRGHHCCRGPTSSGPRYAMPYADGANVCKEIAISHCC